MKYLLSLLLSLLVGLSGIADAAYVKSYRKKSGTTVRAHHRKAKTTFGSHHSGHSRRRSHR